MLKPLTLSLSLAVALGFCSVSMAGIHDGCSTCGLASPQGGPIASAQGPIATTCETGCAAQVQPRQPLQWPPRQAEGRVSSPSLLRVGPEEEAAVGTPRRWLRAAARPAAAAPVYPTGQVAPSGQGGYAAPSGQGGYAAPQAAPVYGAGQHTYQPAKPAATIASVPAEMTPSIAGDEAPPAPEVKETSGLLLPAPSGN